MQHPALATLERPLDPASAEPPTQPANPTAAEPSTGRPSQSTSQAQAYRTQDSQADGGHGAPRSDVVAALRDSAPVGLGLVPLGLAFGVFLTHSGLAWWWAIVFATCIYAGSFEFLLVGLVGVAAPLATIATTAFLVNVRHVFYSLSFPLHRVGGTVARAYSTFAMTDEAYALTTSGPGRSWPGRRIPWLQLFLHSYWVGGAALGGLAGSLIPSSIHGLDFALTALFAVLAVDAIRARRDDLGTPALALLCALIARFVFPGQLLLVAFGLFAAALVGRQVAARPAPQSAATGVRSHV